MRKKYGLLGKNINYSFSPQLHKEIFNFLKCSYNYNIFDLEENEIENLIKRIKEDEIQGINITIPYKQTVMRYLDEISENAQKIGAVNTVYKKDNKLIGENTDYYGFLKTIESMKLNLKNENVAVLGSGGSAKAVVQVIKNLGGKIFLVSRTPQNVDSHFTDMEIIDYEKLKNISGKLIVNCTPLGGKNYSEISPIDEETAEKWECAVELNYTPEFSPFLLYFKNNNKKYMNGFYMLVAQGIESENIWQNKNIPVDAIYNKVYNNVYKKFD